MLKGAVKDPDGICVPSMSSGMVAVLVASRNLRNRYPASSLSTQGPQIDVLQPTNSRVPFSQASMCGEILPRCMIQLISGNIYICPCSIVLQLFPSIICHTCLNKCPNRETKVKKPLLSYHVLLIYIYIIEPYWT